MDDLLRRPVATPPYAVTQRARHQILVCQTCRHKGDTCQPGLQLLERLRLAIAAAGLGDGFEVSGTACMAGCDRPCTVAWRATSKATWLFGDISPDEDIDDLVAFARLYRDLDDGWCRASDRPGKLAEHVLARIPAALIVTGEEVVQ